MNIEMAKEAREALMEQTMEGKKTTDMQMIEEGEEQDATGAAQRLPAREKLSGCRGNEARHA